MNKSTNFRPARWSLSLCPQKQSATLQDFAMICVILHELLVHLYNSVRAREQVVVPDDGALQLVYILLSKARI
jgi:hypothetical protein